MVAGLNDSLHIIQKVKTIYEWIDKQVRLMDPSCNECGQCCDFEHFGHRLYVTTPEMFHFQHYAGPNVKMMTMGVCPYRVKGKCSVYPFRFSGCRIFSCKGKPEKENALCEQAVKKFKILCEEYSIPYHYVCLQDGLEMLRHNKFDIQN